MRTPLAILSLIIGADTAATASLTTDQSSRLQAAMDAQGCAGGNVNVGESGFEVEGAKCGGDRIYDLAFDHDYKLMRKEPRN